VTTDRSRMNIAPVCLFDPDDPPKYPSRAECEALFTRILKMTRGGGDTTVWVFGSWSGNLRWARNRLTTPGDVRDVSVRISRVIRGAPGDASTNRMDDEALRRAVENAESLAQYRGENPDANSPPGKQYYLATHTWSDATSTLDERARSELARRLVIPSLSAGLLQAGYLNATITTRAVFNTEGMAAYQSITRASYSVTVRNAKGTGSGWAGASHYDWSRIDPDAVTARAQAKCVSSSQPKTIEPGRYTVILEPQAVAELMQNVVSALDRPAAESMPTPFTLKPGQSKIGVKMFDSRVEIGTDPTDPDGGYIAFDWDGFPFRPVKWVEGGILKALSYGRDYALEQLGEGAPLPNPMAFRMAGGTATVAEMIKSTDRGLLVTRFGGVTVVDNETLLTTGVTRDGVWLIEDGVIKFAVKNFRFSDSPLFVLNKIEQMGVPEQVFSPYDPYIVPALKVRDFNFTSLADAV